MGYIWAEMSGPLFFLIVIVLVSFLVTEDAACLSELAGRRFLDKRSKREFLARIAFMIEVEPGSYKVECIRIKN